MRSSNPPSKFSQEAAEPRAVSHARASGPEMRATLDGLEVLPSHFDQWLNAGGERRRKPRNAPSQSAKR